MGCCRQAVDCKTCCKAPHAAEPARHRSRWPLMLSCPQPYRTWGCDSWSLGKAWGGGGSRSNWHRRTSGRLGGPVRHQPPPTHVANNNPSVPQGQAAALEWLRVCCALGCRQSYKACQPTGTLFWSPPQLALGREQGSIACPCMDGSTHAKIDTQ
jgi:hypothetical protein